MQTTVAPYGHTMAHVSAQCRAVCAAIYTLLRTLVPKHDALVTAVQLVAPRGTCDYATPDAQHDPATDEVEWRRYDRGQLDHFVVTCCRSCLPDVVKHALDSGTCDRPAVRAGFVQELMQVSVHTGRDDQRFGDEVFARSTPLWLSTRCQCGRLRGRPEQHQVKKHGCVLTLHTWTNPCGHQESLDALLAESALHRTDASRAAA